MGTTPTDPGARQESCTTAATPGPVSHRPPARPIWHGSLRIAGSLRSGPPATQSSLAPSFVPSVTPCTPQVAIRRRSASPRTPLHTSNRTYASRRPLSCRSTALCSWRVRWQQHDPTTSNHPHIPDCRRRGRRQARRGRQLSVDSIWPNECGDSSRSYRRRTRGCAGSGRPRSTRRYHGTTHGTAGPSRPRGGACLQLLEPSRGSRGRVAQRRTNGARAGAAPLPEPAVGPHLDSSAARQAFDSACWTGASLARAGLTGSVYAPRCDGFRGSSTDRHAPRCCWCPLPG